MKYSIESEEMIQAMADEWRESFLLYLHEQRLAEKEPNNATESL